MGKGIGRAAGYAPAAAVGIVTGMLTLIGQKYLSIDLNFLANSASVWVVPAFMTAYLLNGGGKQSALYGIAVLTACVLGYYVFEAAVNRHSYFINAHQLLWLGCAVIGGAAVGLFAHAARTKTGIIGDFCANLIPAVFVTEASSKLFHINDYRHMLTGLFVQMAIGLALYAAVNGKRAFKKENLISFAVLLILGNAAFEALWRIA